MEENEDLFADEKPATQEYSIVIPRKAMSKAALKDAASEMINAVEQGIIPALDLFVQMKAVAIFTDEVVSAIKNKAFNDAEKLHKEERIILGAEVEVCQGSTKYEFDHDERWKQINFEIDVLKNRLKDREKQMIHALSSANAVDEHGEIIPKAKVVSGTAAHLKTKFK